MSSVIIDVRLFDPSIANMDAARQKVKASFDSTCRLFAWFRGEQTARLVRPEAVGYAETMDGTKISSKTLFESILSGSPRRPQWSPAAAFRFMSGIESCHYNWYCLLPYCYLTGVPRLMDTRIGDVPWKFDFVWNN